MRKYTNREPWGSSAAMKGDNFAVGYIAFLNSKYQHPIKHRTVGIARLIQGYTGVGKNSPDAMKAYKAKVAAVKHKADPATLSFTPGPPVPGAPATSMLQNPLPEGVDSPDCYISYSPLGHSLALPGPPPHNFFEDTTNPRYPPQSVGREWAATLVAKWPLGLRVIGSNGFLCDPMKLNSPENPPLLISLTSKHCSGSVSSHHSDVVETSPRKLPVVHGTTGASPCSLSRAFTWPLSSASVFLAGVIIKNNSPLTSGISA